MSNRGFLYSEMCSVSVVQPFYRNTISRQTIPALPADIRFVPTDDCIQLMNRLQIGFKRDDAKGGFFIFGNIKGKNAQQEELLRFTPAYTDILRFWMVVDNPNTLNYDDFPIRLPSDQLLFLTNDRVTSDPNSELHLTSREGGITNDSTSDEYDWVPTSGSVYQYSLALPAVGSIKHVITGIEIKPVSSVRQSGITTMTFDLSSLPLGFCELYINEAFTTRFYFTGDELPTRAIGVVELSLSSSIDTEYRIVKTAGVLPKTHPAFVIRLQNRPTIWRYTIRLDSTGSLAQKIATLEGEALTTFLEQLNIITNDEGISFLMNSASTDELIFMSTAPIPLQEQYRISTDDTDMLELSLKKDIDPDISSPGVVVKSNLPYPSTTLISPEHDADSNTDFIYSDIFLTL